jgi:hypothetical protein
MEAKQSVGRNIFILTTEYHFLLTMLIIEQQFADPGQWTHLLVFTGPRLNGVEVSRLPAHIEVMILSEDAKVMRVLALQILSSSPANIFVFTAYRAFETLLLTRSGRRTKKHLVQDGANFYFSFNKSVFIDRLRETWRIYRDLLKSGFLLKHLVFYKKDISDTRLVNVIWLTHPSLRNRIGKLDVREVILPTDDRSITRIAYYFNATPGPYDRKLLYLANRLKSKSQFDAEIDLVRRIRLLFPSLSFELKLHPASTIDQRETFIKEFGSSVTMTNMPAELKLAVARDCVVVGTASVALFYYNSSCKYFSCIKEAQELGLFPPWISVNLPSHVQPLVFSKPVIDG